MLGFYLSMLDTEDEKNLFEELYRKYSQDMYAVAFDILNNQADAEDAVHQSFLKIANNFTKISSIPRNEIKAYIVIICRNTSFNLYNQNKRDSKRKCQLNESELVDDSFFEKESIDDLKKAIRLLDDKYKDVLYLYCLQGFSASETSKILDISVNNVRQRVMRAKQQLKKILERGEGFGR